uniref:Uncharacterized protein n=1 Tax=Anticarsia gemmatalis multiple nucleopolyhedrovirus TaxID=268591 RepID=A0A0S3J0H3_9ABAC|nr:hypothetical protein AGNV_126 [Anticarsia gemmatalis multiple nucleopolyhedrovirus]ALR71346.1 hypothetical protein AGNV_126 [Anticarsia gemmatalis multiple nucleopolyhedrovirus]ALR71504.1 hypothetical protein AGNV_126 [Anticarsia gemmatalis multiple nucleopolyhedrovirus]
MAPSRSLQRAIKQNQHVRVADLALETKANRLFLLLDCHSKEFWMDVSRNCYNRDRFLAAFANKVDWNAVSASPLTIATARTFADKLNWAIVSRQSHLTQQFIYEMGERMDMQIVSANYNNLSLAVQQKYAAILNWNYIVPSHCMLREWFDSPISDYICFDLVAKYKHLNRLHINTPHCITKINLNVYMQNLNKVSDALIIYCLREGRVQELKAISGTIPWADHMYVFDEYPGLVETLHADWATVTTWNFNNAPPAFYIRQHLTGDAFKREFVATAYWNKFINYATGTQNAASAAFALMVFDNFKSQLDWETLLPSDRFVNLAALHRMNGPLVAFDAADDLKVWRAYGKFVSGSDVQECKHIIPMNMNVRDAYHKMTLVQACMSQREHDDARTCERLMALNGGEEAVLNWNMLSATQQVCPFNLRHLQNVNAQTYRRDNPHFVQQVYEMMIAAQMNLNGFL